MPKKKNALKALRQSKKLALKNKTVKTKIKTIIKNARRIITEKKLSDATTLVKEAIKNIDKAAQKKILKKNTAARKKSRLIKKLNTIAKEIAK